MGDRPMPFLQPFMEDKHVNLLSNVLGSTADEAKGSIVHNYVNSFSGFAARLSPEEATKLQSMDDVVTVFPNGYHKLHTTRSWNYLGFPETVKRNPSVESNIVVGLFDSGISPDAESFNDKGFGPPPAKWKGTCQFKNASKCNKYVSSPCLLKMRRNKRARYYKLDGKVDPLEELSPLDSVGHGTHTASTVAGNLVLSASLYGLGQGTARGAVPSARVAMYKVCWASTGCSDLDLLAAFDAAIQDGVDLISLSLGGGADPSYTADSISIGSFHAMKKGILTVASAGNNGPDASSIDNHAPWLLTVAASGTDWQFRSKITLGNGKELSGIGINIFTPNQTALNKTSFPLVSGANVPLSLVQASLVGSRYCLAHSLEPTLVKGKVVLCELEEGGVDSVVKGVGGIGAIIQSEKGLDNAQIYMAPATMIDPTAAVTVNDYITKNNRSASAVIHRTEEVKIKAPFIASFSSRGPNPGSKLILKPDISAPGINILAAFTPLSTITGLKGDTKYSKFTFISGTSMACPHVAGIAAYIKSFHPSWSPAAIKSAIITTATPMSSAVNPDAEFAYGAGQINPMKALNPGLVYDSDEKPYIQFLCNGGYKGPGLALLVGAKSVDCAALPPSNGTDFLNYPTIQLGIKSTKDRLTVGVFNRQVTNVGPPQSVYKSIIQTLPGLEVTVMPISLSFTRANEVQSFKVVVTVKPGNDMSTLSGSLVWTSPQGGGITVRSSIIAYNQDVIFTSS
ncbi:hypothetical protein GIB67_019182 [Kingdonia uniflora]|uniref:Uncharacterized protein n=1 Tax=Kingdonia uniflora TaxID=39325 RepID=A0A7J7MZU0_9MAGN|nr:hypothetical protein GIB67_019182 [Kingdonia uniflora]